MAKTTQLPFTSVLDALFTTDPLPLEHLYRLSDLSSPDFQEFCQRWLDAAAERRRVIIRHLVDICEENYVVDFVPIFAFAFTDPFPPVRTAALDGVWDTTNHSLVNPIIKIMQSDDDEAVRVAAISALAHFVLLGEWQQIPAAISSLIIEALLAEFEKPELSEPAKRAALEALGAASHPKVPQLIEEAYEGDSFDLQLSAIFAMGSNADSRWLRIVIDEMESHEAEMRAEAARAAGEIGGSDAVNALANLTLDEDTVVALAAIGALGQIGGSKAEEILQEISRNPEFEQLHKGVEEALEEITWLGGEMNFDWLSIDNEPID